MCGDGNSFAVVGSLVVREVFAGRHVVAGFERRIE